MKKYYKWIAVVLFAIALAVLVFLVMGNVANAQHGGPPPAIVDGPANPAINTLQNPGGYGSWATGQYATHAWNRHYTIPRQMDYALKSYGYADCATCQADVWNANQHVQNGYESYGQAVNELHWSNYNYHQYGDQTWGSRYP